MRIGIDVDGVLRNLYDKLIEIYLRENPSEWCKPLQEWKSYYLKDNFSNGEDIYSFLWDSGHSQEIYLKAPSFPGIDIIDQMHQENEIEIITSQPNNRTAQYTLHWIRSMKIPYHGLHFTHDKCSIDCDVYVEDSPEHIHDMLHCGKQVVVIDYGYNKNGKDGPFDGAVTRM